jgi:hypothetical protein
MRDPEESMREDFENGRERFLEVFGDHIRMEVT